MSTRGSASDDRYLIGASLQEYGPEPNGRLDYLYHLLDLVEHTPSTTDSDVTPVNKDSAKEGFEKDHPLRVIDM
jgi:hypothetical protein